jgi:hypothetical protein
MSPMGSTPTKSAMVSGLPFYVWEVPGKPISIQLHFEVIDRVSPEILRGLGALKRRGAEVGGILLGRVEDGPRPTVIVEDFETVRSEYLTGPSYNLSENDLVAFEAALSRWKSDPAGKLSVVGFYRSHTRDELYMDDADLELVRRYFPEPQNVFLLIKPFATRPCIAGFFFWEDGEIYREATYLQFPFQRRDLGGGEPQYAPPQASPPPSNSAPAPRRAQPEGSALREESPLPPYTPEAERQPVRLTPFEELLPATRTSNLSILSTLEEPGAEARKLKWRWLLVPGFLAIAAVGGFVAYRNLEDSKASASQESTEPALPLRLSVSEKNNQLDVTWDRNALAVTRAKRGVLSISDGSKRRDLELTGAQLRNGRVLYSRLSGDVNLRLEVFPEGQPTVIESIRVVSTDTAPPVPPPPVQAVRPAAAPKYPKTVAAPPAPRIPSKPAAGKSATKAPVAQPPAEPEVDLQRPPRRR